MDVAGPLPSEGGLEALDTAVARALELAKGPGVLEKVLETPFGPMPGAAFLMNPFTDLLIHRWDLAKGTNQDTSLDSGLVQVCYQAVAPHLDEFRQVEVAGQHIFGPAVQVPDSAGLQDKLLAASGRKP